MSCRSANCSLATRLEMEGSEMSKSTNVPFLIPFKADVTLGFRPFFEQKFLYFFRFYYSSIIGVKELNLNNF